MTRLSRRSVLRCLGIGFVSAWLLKPKPAFATPTTISYTVAYTGADFTSFITATTATVIGSDPAASSTGNVTLGGATSTTVPLALTETRDLLGHVITITGVTGSYLITAWNNTTKVATIGARAGFSGTFASTPGTGVAYAVADVTFEVVIGQSASGNNNWVDVSGDLSITGFTFDSTHGLKIKGNTPWNRKYQCRYNANYPAIPGIDLSDRPIAALGDPNQPVSIFSRAASSNGYININLSGTGNFITIEDLQIIVASNNGAVIGFSSSNLKATFNRCAVLAWTPQGGAINIGGSIVGNNSFFSCPTSRAGSFVFYGGSTFNCCGVTGWDETGLISKVALSYSAFGTSTFNNSWIFACTSMADCVFNNCYSDVAATGITQVTAMNSLCFPNGVLYSDYRPQTTSPLIASGGVPPVATDLYGVTRSGSASSIGPIETATTRPAVQNITFSVANSGGDITVLTDTQIFDKTTGSDSTYFQSGMTCPSTAADNTHIVLDASATSAAIGHAITWNGQTRICISIAGNVAHIGAIAGFAGTWTGTPQSGDAYSIAPSKPIFMVGNPASGNNWAVTQGYLGITQNTGAWILSAINSPDTSTSFTSSQIFSKTGTTLGQISDQAVPCLTNGADHTGLFYCVSPYVDFDHLQMQCDTTTEMEGLVTSVGIPHLGYMRYYRVTMTKCLGRNNSHSSPIPDHQAFLEIPALPLSRLIADTCVFVNTTWQQQFTTFVFKSIDCTLLCSTANASMAATVTAALGSTSVKVASTAGISENNTVTGTISCWIMHPSIPADTRCHIIDATTIGLVNGGGGSVAITGAINSGESLYFGPGVGVFQPSIFSNGQGEITNTLICGACLAVQGDAGGGGGFPVITTSATDSPMMGTASEGTQVVSGTGFASVNYAVLFNNASGAGGTSLDIRLAAGASVLAGQGTHRASNPSDFFEVARANPPTIGAIEFVATGASGGANFFHASPF